MYLLLWCSVPSVIWVAIGHFKMTIINIILVIIVIVADLAISREARTSVAASNVPGDMTPPSSRSCHDMTLSIVAASCYEQCSLARHGSSVQTTQPIRHFPLTNQTIQHVPSCAQLAETSSRVRTLPSSAQLTQYWRCVKTKHYRSSYFDIPWTAIFSPPPILGQLRAVDDGRQCVFGDGCKCFGLPPVV